MINLQSKEGCIVRQPFSESLENPWTRASPTSFVAVGYKDTANSITMTTKNCKSSEAQVADRLDYNLQLIHPQDRIRGSRSQKMPRWNMTRARTRAHRNHSCATEICRMFSRRVCLRLNWKSCCVCTSGFSSCSQHQDEEGFPQHNCEEEDDGESQVLSSVYEDQAHE